MARKALAPRFCSEGGCLPSFVGRMPHSALQAGTVSLRPRLAFLCYSVLFLPSVFHATLFFLLGHLPVESGCGLPPAKKRLAAACGKPNALLAPPMGGYLLWHGTEIFRKSYLLSALQKDVNLGFIPHAFRPIGSSAKQWECRGKIHAVTSQHLSNWRNAR